MAFGILPNQCLQRQVNANNEPGIRPASIAAVMPVAWITAGIDETTELEQNENYRHD